MTGRTAGRVVAEIHEVIADAVGDCVAQCLTPHGSPRLECETRATAKANAAHLAACWNAVESVGGDPAVVGEMREALARTAECLRQSLDYTHGLLRDKAVTQYADARAILARATVTP